MIIFKGGFRFIVIQAVCEYLPYDISQRLRFQHNDLFAVRENFLNKIIGRMKEKFENGVFQGFFHTILRAVKREALNVLPLLLAAFDNNALWILMDQIHYAKGMSEVFLKVVSVFLPKSCFAYFQRRYTVQTK